MYLRRLVAFASASAVVLTACASTPSVEVSAESSLPVVKTSFYPLHYLTERIAGDLLKVESLTAPGADAHHLELSPAAIAELGQAGAVVYAEGFQDAVDEAVEANAPAAVINVAPAVDLLATAEEGEEHDHDHKGHDHGQSEEAHEHHDHEAHDHDHDHGGMDPHFWLDPQRMAQAALAIGEGLTKAFPEHGDIFAQNAEAVAGEMTALSTELVNATKECQQTSFVTAHKAFGYLADRAGLTQVGMSDVDPEATPSPARLAEVAQIIKERGIKTIFSEHLIDPKVAETFAKDLGVATATLDPLESQNDPAKDYIAVMKENIATLHQTLECK